MEMTFIYLLIILSVLFILNSIATYIVWNTHFEVKERRIYQTIFIWLVPIIGASMAIYINREDDFAKKQQPQVGNNSNITDSQAISFGSHTGGGR